MLRILMLRPVSDSWSLKGQRSPFESANGSVPEVEIMIATCSYYVLGADTFAQCERGVV